jgi:hypothetical protein
MYLCTSEVITYGAGEWACKLIELDLAPGGCLKLQKRLSQRNLVEERFKTLAKSRNAMYDNTCANLFRFT